MITFLSKVFMKDLYAETAQEVRRKYGVLFGAVGIGLNIILFLIKLIAGIISGSVAIVADALNNLSDGGSSLISLVGFKLSGQKPDPTHPFGHGRFEYITGLIISMVIIMMGGELFISSIRKIVHPAELAVNKVSIVILVISIFVKLYMFYYNKMGSIKFKSAVMGATAMDSLCDSISTFVVLVCMLIYKYTGFNLDGFGGLLVGCFIIYTGVMSAKDTINPLLGAAPDKDFVEKIEKFVMSYDGIEGVHDLIVHDYGAGRMMISLHAEVSAEGNILDLHDTIDNIEHKLHEVLGCFAVIHMDPIMVNDDSTNRMKRLTELVVKSVDEAMTIHDFRMVMGQTHTNLIFDVVLPYYVKLTESEAKEEISKKIEALPGNLYAVIDIDRPMV